MQYRNSSYASGEFNTYAAQYNPFRYRGYYYDSELGFYYLNSRYYDPETGRFVNADSMVSTGQGILGYNMFAYCLNEPVFRKDAHGTEGVVVENFDEDNNPHNDLGKSPSGQGSGGGGKGKSGGNSNNRSAGVCFVVGTLIATRDANVVIEEIDVGDYVWASDPEMGEIALKQVVQTFVNETDELIHITVNGEEIVLLTTEDKKLSFPKLF